jgi:hypothetical protein
VTKQQSHASLPSYLIICNKTLAISRGFISSCVVKCSNRATEKQTFPGNIIEFQTHHVPPNNQQGPPPPPERSFSPSYYHPLYTHLPKERKKREKGGKKKEKTIHSSKKKTFPTTWVSSSCRLVPIENVIFESWGTFCMLCT